MEGTLRVNDDAHGVKVLYIGGCGRSGSTVLGNVLGELDGFFHAGELRTIWGRGLQRGRLCGCGLPIGECDFWRSVLKEALRDHGDGSLDPAEVFRLQREVIRLRHVPYMLRARRGQELDWKPLRDYSEAASRLYVSIADVAGAGVIVDSSKRHADAALLRLLPSIQPFYVQLVRDPRAVAYSWRRTKTSPTRGGRPDMAQLSPVVVARNWVLENVSVEAVRRRHDPSNSMLVRYETFVDKPRQTLRGILHMLGEERSELPFVDGRTIMLNPGHTAGGNPDRFRTGTVALREDTEWLEQQPQRDRVISTIISLPLLRRYGYRVFPRRAG
ncbi:MAG: sulfotransferase [Actinomycetota bacterium]